MKVVLFFAFFFLLPLGLRAAQCQLPSESWQQELSKRNKIVFFASWCQSCVESIQSSDPTKDIYIAVFDTKEKAELALNHVLGGNSAATCLWDKNNAIASKYGVKNLPRTIEQTSQNQDR